MKILFKKYLFSPLYHALFLIAGSVVIMLYFTDNTAENIVLSSHQILLSIYCFFSCMAILFAREPAVEAIQWIIGLVGALLPLSMVVGMISEVNGTYDGLMLSEALMASMYIILVYGMASFVVVSAVWTALKYLVLWLVQLGSGF